MKVFANRHLEQAYNQSKFEIKQKMMCKQAKFAFTKKGSNASTGEGEK